MHELGYCEALLPVVVARADGRTVTDIGVRAGVRHGLMPDVMQMAWELVADEANCCDATLHLEPTLMVATCQGCGCCYDTDDTLCKCPACSEVGAFLSGGDEFGLAWVAYSDGREAETDPSSITVDMSDHHHDDDDQSHRHSHTHDERHDHEAARSRPMAGG